MKKQQPAKKGAPAQKPAAKKIEAVKPVEFSAENFPHLTSFARGYLHEDYKEEHGSAIGAMDEFCYVAHKRERDSLKREFEAFLKFAENRTFEKVRNWWTRDLGSGWLPPDKKALLALQALLNQADKDKKR